VVQPGHDLELAPKPIEGLRARNGGIARQFQDDSNAIRIVRQHHLAGRSLPEQLIDSETIDFLAGLQIGVHRALLRSPHTAPVRGVICLRLHQRAAASKKARRAAIDRGLNES
jgi:hypothetical protein